MIEEKRRPLILCVGVATLDVVFMLDDLPQEAIKYKAKGSNFFYRRLRAQRRACDLGTGWRIDFAFASGAGYGRRFH